MNLFFVRIKTLANLEVLLPIVLLFCAECLASTLYYEKPLQKPPADPCSLTLVESIPENLTFPNSSAAQSLSTYEAYQFLVSHAASELRIASLYWSLRGSDIMQNPGQLAAKGEHLYESMLNLSRHSRIRIVNNIGGLEFNHSDLELLARQSNVGLVWLNITGLLGAGVQHAKLVLADGAHAYLGSSNIDWRSLTQVKELGLLMVSCPTLVQELEKVFQTYWITGSRNSIPDTWPASLHASINASRPWITDIGGFKYSIYLGVSPAQLTPPNWSRDIDGVVQTIDSAKKFVHIAVMDYQAVLYPAESFQKFWGVIDNALRAAAFRGVKIRLLVSHWEHSNRYVGLFLKSLTALNDTKSPIEGKFFVVPIFNDDQKRIPFARVNHNKYMVTEDTAVICTSNWEGSYFTFTTGVAAFIKQLSTGDGKKPELSIVEQTQAVFWRDWTSEYAHTTLPR